MRRLTRSLRFVDACGASQRCESGNDEIIDRAHDAYFASGDPYIPQASRRDTKINVADNGATYVTLRNINLVLAVFRESKGAFLALCFEEDIPIPPPNMPWHSLPVTI